VPCGSRWRALYGRNHEVQSSKVYDSEKADRFTADTAKNTGRSESIVQKEAARGANLKESTIAAIVGTALDKGVILDRIGKEKTEVGQHEAIAREIAAIEERQTAPKIEQELRIAYATEAAEIINGNVPPHLIMRPAIHGYLCA
jgi:hypothetical protein